jgi:hypothetical protein
MQNYDIILLDDDPMRQFLIGCEAKSKELELIAVSSLKTLEDALKDSNAQLFIVDGNFPRVEGGQILYLAHEAIDLIRKYRPDAKIALNSADRKAEATAQEKKVAYVEKKGGCEREMVEFVRIMGI